MDVMTSDQYTELVGYLGQKFDGIDRRFDGIDRRFDGIDRKFDAVDQKFDAVDRRFEGVDQKFEGVYQNIEESRRHATVLFEQSQANLKAVAEGLGLRIERLEEAVVDLSGTVRDGFADHERRIQVLEGAGSEGVDDS